MEDNFYITLPSNVGHTFENNTIANYTTKLASRLELNGEWEVGLVEMSYTVSWYNEPEPQTINLLYWDKGMPMKYDTEMTIPAGRYDTIDDILFVINELFKSLKLRTQFNPMDLPEMKVNKRNRIVTIRQGLRRSDNKLIFVSLPEDLCLMLGFDKKKMDEDYGKALLEYGKIESTVTDKNRPTYTHTAPSWSQKNYRGQHPYELSAGYHSLFVYTDIVKPSFVGNSFTQLLRLVQVPSNATFGDQILITYPNTYYIPLMTKDFETIEIDIKDDTGESIPFEFGRCIVVLHFRRKLYKG